MNGCNTSTVSTSSDRSSRYLLRTVVDAMLDSLTVEQQTKMASYLLRVARQQNRAQQEAEILPRAQPIPLC